MHPAQTKRFLCTVDEFQYFFIDPSQGHYDKSHERLWRYDDCRLLQIVESKLKSTFRRLGLQERESAVEINVNWCSREMHTTNARAYTTTLKTHSKTYLEVSLRAWCAWKFFMWKVSASTYIFIHLRVKLIKLFINSVNLNDISIHFF